VYYFFASFAAGVLCRCWSDSAFYSYQSNTFNGSPRIHTVYLISLLCRMMEGRHVFLLLIHKVGENFFVCLKMTTQRRSTTPWIQSHKSHLEFYFPSNIIKYMLLHTHTHTHAHTLWPVQ